MAADIWRRMHTAIRDIASALIFPHYCPGCGKEWSSGVGWICPACYRALPRAGSGLWNHNSALRHRLLVALKYDGLTRNLVHQLKFAGRDDVAKPLGIEAARRAGAALRDMTIVAVVPVPLHPIRIRERGYDQNFALAAAIAGEFGLPLCDNVIRRVRNTPPQSRLSDAQRLVNLKGAFQPQPSSGHVLRGTVLLVDDVIHTGATALGCMEALTQAGVEDAVILAVCG